MFLYVVFDWQLLFVMIRYSMFMEGLHWCDVRYRSILGSLTDSEVKVHFWVALRNRERYVSEVIRFITALG